MCNNATALSNFESPPKKEKKGKDFQGPVVDCVMPHFLWIVFVWDSLEVIG